MRDLYGCDCPEYELVPWALDPVLFDDPFRPDRGSLHRLFAALHAIEHVDGVLAALRVVRHTSIVGSVKPDTQANGLQIRAGEKP